MTSAVTSAISSGVSGSATMARLRHPSRRLTTRAAILAAVICALVLSLAYPLKQYLAQRGSISQLRHEIATREAALAQLKERKRELSDPTYIKSRARQRLQYVMPGDTQFVVVHQGEHPDAAGQPRSTRTGATSPWYAQLWDSVQKADRSP